MFPIPRARALAAVVGLASSMLLGCGNSEPIATPIAPAPTPPVTPPTTPAPPTSPQDQGKALSSYLRNLSPKLEGVTAEAAAWEHYNIPVSDGTVLDGWVKRPPGEVGQPLVIVFSPYYGGGDPNYSLLGTP